MDHKDQFKLVEKSNQESNKNLSDWVVNFDNNSPSFHPWKQDASCKNLTVRFAAKKFFWPPTALVSYPGSGNTFFRDGSTILIKTHHNHALNEYSYWKVDRSTRKAFVEVYEGWGILLIRNPFEAIMSYYNLERTMNKTGTVPISEFKSEKFQQFSSASIIRWYEVIADWLDFGDKVYIVFYEDLMSNPLAEVEAALNYFGYPIQADMKQCLINNFTESINNNLRRKSHHNDCPFNEDNILLFRLMIDLAAKKLKEKTGKVLPHKKYRCYPSDELRPLAAIIN